MKCFKFLRCIKFTIFIFLAISLLSLLVMRLWNWLIPSLFAGVTAISFYQAVGLLILSRILFGGFGGKKGRWGKCCRCDDSCRTGPRGHFFKRMTTEERATFKANVQDKFDSTRA